MVEVLTECCKNRGGGASVYSIVSKSIEGFLDKVAVWELSLRKKELDKEMKDVQHIPLGRRI